MPDKKDSFTDGKKDGGKWQRWAEDHPIDNAINPLAPSKPHRSDDDDYNEGVDEGIKERKNRKD